MRTDLHQKLRSMCEISRGDDSHWLIKGSKTIYIPELQEIVTTRRAIYAAFVGQVLENMDVVANCDMARCARPEHIIQAPSRRKSRPLALPDQVASLESFTRGERANRLPQVLPRGMTIAAIRRVRHMVEDGNTLSQVAIGVGLAIGEVVKIVNGVYDEAARNVGGPAVFSKTTRSVVDIPDRSMPTLVGPVAGAEVEIPDVASEEEQEWLKRLGRE